MYHYRLFDAIDENKDKHLSAGELKALIIGIRFDEIDLNQDDAVNKVLQDFDTSNDSLISLQEFRSGIQKWLDVARREGAVIDGAGPQTMKLLNDYHKVSFNNHISMLLPFSTQD